MIIRFIKALYNLIFKKKEIEQLYIERLSICKNCPMKKPCFDEGMKPENIPHGIWGGTLAGERILVSNIPRNTDMMTKTIPFAKEVRARFSIA